MTASPEGGAPPGLASARAERGATRAPPSHSRISMGCLTRVRALSLPLIETPTIAAPAASAAGVVPAISTRQFALSRLRYGR
jgi:hypothetical protein